MKVQLVASCTERKRAMVPEELRLRAVDNGPGEARASAWLTRLDQHSSPTMPARHLYGGEHWQLVLDLERELIEAARDVDLWVASAGYGLVSADASLKPYSATFASGEPDSISSDAVGGWWQALCAGHPQAKTLQHLATKAETMIVIASAKYLRAMLPDLLLAREALGDSGQLIVFSGSRVPELESSQIVVDGCVQVALRHETTRALRGTKQGLAARTARHLLTQADAWPPAASALQNAYARLVSDLERPKPPDRERHGDDDVRVFIDEQLEHGSAIGWTKLLRLWRESGHACEQKRFRGLYQEAVAKRSEK
jgi:hypothetical protein